MSLRRWLLAVFIAIQLTIPGYQLVARYVDEGAHPTTERWFSWQMYSR